jgi:hypothetical protein
MPFSAASPDSIRIGPGTSTQARRDNLPTGATALGGGPAR